MAIDRVVTNINGAFLAEIKEDNRQLRDILWRLQQLCSRGAKRVEPERLSELLGELRDNLSMHFALEATYGYIEEPVAVAPYLEARSSTLQREHESLFREIVEIADQAESLLYPHRQRTQKRKVIDRFEEFRNRLMTHESAENDLVCEAFQRDLGDVD